MAVNKAASSKIKMLLHPLEGYPLPTDQFDVHARTASGVSFVGKLSPADAVEAVELCRGAGWRRFAFVRNPYARLYSAYKNKIADLTSPYMAVRSAIWRAAGAHHPPERAPSFQAFVRYVAQTPDQARDGHWRSQSGCLCTDLIDYAFLGRVERFAEDFSKLLRSLDAPGWLHQDLAEVVGASEGQPASAAYDAGLAQRVYEAYRADFAAFDYPRDGWRD
jgi:hypothetical protein